MDDGLEGASHSRERGRAWAYRVHANATRLQVRRPCPCEGAHSSLCGAINTIRRQAFASDNGSIQDNRGAVRQQRKRLLHREKQAFYIDVEGQVIELLGYLAEGGILRHTGIGEYDIELALLLLDLCEQAIKIAKVRHVSLHAGYISSDLFDCHGQFGITTTRDEDMRAFVHKLLCRRKANAAIATGNECDFSFKLVHVLLSSHQNCLIGGRPCRRADPQPGHLEHQPDVAVRGWRATLPT